jgi:DegV family protein with EDD domain
MSSYVIITDSSADLSAELLAKYEIGCLQLEVTLEGEGSHPNNEIDPKPFYDALRAKKGATTSASSPAAFRETFKSYLDAGKDILYLGFSSGLSSTYNAGFIAARELREEYPDRKILTVDTLCAALGEGLIVLLAAKKREAGADIDTVCAYVKGLIPHLAHWFTVDDLFFLKRGGRVSGATAVVGSMLQIKPVMHVDNAGHLIKVTTARGRRGSLDALVQRMKDSLLDHPDQTVTIGHGDCPEDAKYVADRIRETMGLEVEVIDYVGPVIGAHAGPGVVALFFLGKER